MTRSTFVVFVLLSLCSVASAQNVVLTGHVQRVILHPAGVEGCPPPCPLVTVLPDGSKRICVSNGGGCQTMDVKVDRIYRGESTTPIRRFKSDIGEWGPSFPNTAEQIVVSEHAGIVTWSIATVRDGRVFVDPKQLRSVGGVPTPAASNGELIPLDEVLARSGAGR